MRVQLIGFGVIGQGFAKVLLKKREFLRKKYELDIKVVSISDLSGTAIEEDGIDLKKALEIMEKKNAIIHYPKARQIGALDAIREVEADLVLEATPSNIETGEPGLTHILTAMKLGKHVVTSNKAPLALEFKKLRETSRKYNVELRYEATVGGAMPIINLAKEILSADEIKGIKGILNGTTNYILTRMTKEEAPLDIVLKEAQEMGIAETDPRYDIDGIDTASKLVILANSILGLDITYRDVKVEGIRRITPEAIRLAKRDGKVIKLIGEVRDSVVEVSPRLVPVNHPLNVDGVLNVAMLECDIAGDITVVGKGAGGIETNSAILSDIIEIWRNIK